MSSKVIGRVLAAGTVLILGAGTVMVASADEPGTISLPASCSIEIQSDRSITGRCDEPEPPTSTLAPTTTVAPTTTIAATTTVAPTTTTPSPGLLFSEDFTDPAAFQSRFDYDWAGALHAGSAWGGDKNGWPMDHDMSCGNPNTTSHNVFIGGGNNAHGEDSPASDTAAAFMACLPGGNPASGHLMTSMNTEGYTQLWFSPKPLFNDVRKVCFDNNLTFLGNGQWFQLVFLTAAEAARKPVVDGVTIDTMALGYTSPAFPAGGGPSTFQGTAGAGVRFLVNNPGNGQAHNLAIQAWSESQFQGNGVTAGPATTDKAPRYQICTTDNGNGTLTVVNGSPDGTVHTNIIPGSIPDGQIRVVLEHDEYNPDKHHGDQEIATNSGEGYTYHWDNLLVYN